MCNEINSIITRIRQQRPLIINVTNAVTMDFVANGLLSLGASPVMTSAVEEIDDLLKLAQGVVINIGTLDEAFVVFCEQVLAAANRLNVPVTLDPVGVGASAYRTQTALKLLTKHKISILRGNASEIMALAGQGGVSRGVDSTNQTLDAVDSAKWLTEKQPMVVVISGQTDAVVWGDSVSFFDGGSPLMPMVTGSGCLLSAVISAFYAVLPQVEAVSSAVVFYGLCGETAAKQAKGPGTFKPHFLDALAGIAND